MSALAARRAVAEAARAGRYAPAGAALLPRDVARLAEFVSGAGGRLVALTGAGISTESGVPDYRSPQGSYAKGHKPMEHAVFVRHPLQRARYWARSLRGWRYFANAQPSRTHTALAALEGARLVAGVVTQNVDGLHTRAGSSNVVDLHGRNDTVVCLSCGARRKRVAYQEDVETLNRAWMANFLPPVTCEEDIRADGDAHLAHEDFRDFQVPPCGACGVGILMPDVVFFGGSLRPEVRDRAQRLLSESSRLLILGSSCQVFSAFRLVQSAHREGKPIAMVNIGPTRADPLVLDEWRFPVRCGDALTRVCEQLL